jgi:hypothetical protein
MARTGYGQRGSEAAERLIAAIFDLGGIGYVALNSGQEVIMRTAPGLVSETSAESNFYEELLVNPTLLALAAQRAGLDCGGLNYVAVGYGDFVQLVVPMKNGHLSIGISRKAHAGDLAARVRAVLEQNGMARAAAEPWLLG